MLRSCRPAALTLALALGAPAVAQSDSRPASPLQITPAPEPTRTAQRGRATFFSMDLPAASRPLARGRTMLFGGWQPNERTMIGIGLFSVPKSATAGPRQGRIDPLRDQNRTSRIAAVGMSFRF